jgi:hypothetical protein
MKHSGEQSTTKQKAAYASPELKVYGTVAELTHSGAATVGDAFGGSQSSFDNVAPSGLD